MPLHCPEKSVLSVRRAHSLDKSVLGNSHRQKSVRKLFYRLMVVAVDGKRFFSEKSVKCAVAVYSDIMNAPVIRRRLMMFCLRRVFGRKILIECSAHEDVYKLYSAAYPEYALFSFS